VAEADDGGVKQLRNVGKLVSDYMPEHLYTRHRQYLVSHRNILTVTVETVAGAYTLIGKGKMQQVFVVNEVL
jgi:hypothetical protein